MEQHKQGRFDGYSKRYNCNRLVWFERFTYVGDAIAREKQLKGWTRAKKIWMIERENPAWVDLSEEWGKPVKMFSEGVKVVAGWENRRSFDCALWASLRMTLWWGSGAARRLAGDVVQALHALIS